MHRQSYRPHSPTSSLAVTPTLARFTRARRELEHQQLDRELLVELQRLRAEVHALRVALERRAA